MPEAMCCCTLPVLLHITCVGRQTHQFDASGKQPTPWKEGRVVISPWATSRVGLKCVVLGRLRCLLGRRQDQPLVDANAERIHHRLRPLQADALVARRLITLDLLLVQTQARR